MKIYDEDYYYWDICVEMINNEKKLYLVKQTIFFIKDDKDDDENKEVDF